MYEKKAPTAPLSTGTHTPVAKIRPSMEPNLPLVSICCVAFNHEEFIAKALDSFLSQKTSFLYEIIVHDDASTDKTPSIIQDYQQRHPDIVRSIFQSANKQSTGVAIYPIVFAQAKGKYIATCDGDDYWTDENKLQIQVDYLETHSSSVGCFHNSINVNETGDILKERWLPVYEDRTYTQRQCFEDLHSTYSTSALMFRAHATSALPDWFHRKPSDAALDLILTKHGYLSYLDLNMSAYRIHSQGIWQGKSEKEKVAEIILRHLVFYSAKELRRDYGERIRTVVFNCCRQLASDKEGRKCLRAIFQKRYKPLDLAIRLFLCLFLYGTGFLSRKTKLYIERNPK